MARGNHPLWNVIEGKEPSQGASAWLGRKILEADPQGGLLRTQFDLKPEFTNPLGHIQGGILAAMLDSTMSLALATVIDATETIPTLELKVNFLRPAKGRVIGTGKVIQQTKSVAFLEGKLEDTEGNLIATASATSLIIKVSA